MGVRGDISNPVPCYGLCLWCSHGTSSHSILKVILSHLIHLGELNVSSQRTAHNFPIIPQKCQWHLKYVTRESGQYVKDKCIKYDHLPYLPTPYTFQQGSFRDHADKWQIILKKLRIFPLVLLGGEWVSGKGDKGFGVRRVWFWFPSSVSLNK